MAATESVRHLIGRPGPDEADPYYFRYIDQVEGDDVLTALSAQRIDLLTRLESVTEASSLHRYAPDKWSVREVLAHLNDTERLFAFRAFWFARGFDTPLPSFDQNTATATAKADERSWVSHVDEFVALRDASVALFHGMPEEAWARRGVASGFPFSVRALAFLVVGHVAHHMTVLEDKYW